jgi:hypothetical protein
MNLRQHRSTSNVWERTNATAWRLEKQRWMAGLAAGTLLLAGLRSRSVPRMFMAVGGASLLWWAVAAFEDRQMYGRRLRAAFSRKPAADDYIAEASEASFPASDAPSWTSSTVTTRRARVKY